MYKMHKRFAFQERRFCSFFVFLTPKDCLRKLQQSFAGGTQKAPCWNILERLGRTHNGCVQRMCQIVSTLMPHDAVKTSRSASSNVMSDEFTLATGTVDQKQRETYRNQMKLTSCGVADVVCRCFSEISQRFPRDFHRRQGLQSLRCPMCSATA